MSGISWAEEKKRGEGLGGGHREEVSVWHDSGLELICLSLSDMHPLEVNLVRFGIICCLPSMQQADQLLKKGSTHKRKRREGKRHGAPSGEGLAGQTSRHYTC